MRAMRARVASGSVRRRVRRPWQSEVPARRWPPAANRHTRRHRIAREPAGASVRDRCVRRRRHRWAGTRAAVHGLFQRDECRQNCPKARCRTAWRKRHSQRRHRPAMPAGSAHGLEDVSRTPCTSVTDESMSTVTTGQEKSPDHEDPGFGRGHVAAQAAYGVRGQRWIRTIASVLLQETARHADPSTGRARRTPACEPLDYDSRALP